MLYDLKNELIELRKEYGIGKRKFHSFIERTHPDIIKRIDDLFPQLNNHKTITKIYWVLNDIHDFPVCGNPKCHNKIGVGIEVTSLDKFKYNEFCCRQCYHDSGVWRTRLDETMLLEYGSTVTMNIPVIREKINSSLVEKYGSKEQYYHELKKLAKQTLIKRYNVDNPMKSKEIQKKMHSTMVSRHGVEHALQNNCFLNKANSTKLENFGTLNLMEIEKYRQNFLKKKDLNDRTKRWEQISTDTECVPLFEFNEYSTRCQTDGTIFKWHCSVCNTDFEGRIDLNFFHHNGHFARCPNCFPLISNGISDKEKELVCFLKQFNVNPIENDRTILIPNDNNNWKLNHELDIYVPDMKLAFEFDGLYWHSEEKHEHLNKTESCEKQGIHLIHIFENEWDFKRKIVESRVKNLLRIYDKVVYARKCEVKEVPSKDSFEFQNINHIQGGVHSKVNLGLYYDDELISLMTFSKPRFNKKYYWELVRFCNKLGYHVPGGASKLLKHFERNYNPKSIISYADRRWTMNSNNTVYDKLGFKLNSISQPDYWYWKDSEFSHRSKYQKHKLKSLLQTFDASKTEIQNMTDNGYRRIFDCGNLVYVKEY